MKRIYLIFAILIFSLDIIAQVPEAISYQAIARRNANGEPPLKDTNITIRASILNSLNGEAIYSESHNVVTSKSGVFSIAIGLGSVLNGVFSDINWGNEEKYLKVEIDPEGGENFEISSTSQMMTVPYSFYSKNSGSSSHALFSDSTQFSYRSDTAKFASSFPANLIPYIKIQGNITSPTSCQDSGTIDVTVSGGTPPYSIFWTKSPGESIFGTGNIIEINLGGRYSVLVEDAKGMTATKWFFAENLGVPDAEFILVNNSLCGYRNGSITATSGGTATGFDFYFYEGQSATANNLITTNLSGTNNSIASVLINGDYTVVITNPIDGCSVTEVVTLEDISTVPDILDTDIETTDITVCNVGGVDNGQINAVGTAFGGSGNYEYILWAGADSGSPFMTNNTGLFPQIGSGNYFLKVTDLETGCTSGTVTVEVIDTSRAVALSESGNIDQTTCDLTDTTGGGGY